MFSQDIHLLILYEFEINASADEHCEDNEEQGANNEDSFVAVADGVVGQVVGVRDERSCGARVGEEGVARDACHRQAKERHKDEKGVAEYLAGTLCNDDSDGAQGIVDRDIHDNQHDGQHKEEQGPVLSEERGHDAVHCCEAIRGLLVDDDARGVYGVAHNVPDQEADDGGQENCNKNTLLDIHFIF